MSSYYYAFTVGRRPGVYINYENAMDQVREFLGGEIRVFDERVGARNYVAQFSDEVYDDDETHEEPTGAITVFCYASSNGSYTCTFPDNPEWNIDDSADDDNLTNNRCYLHAALAAIRRVNEENPTNNRRLEIYSNSTYLRDSIKKLKREHMQARWRGLANSDLLNQLYTEKGGRAIESEHESAYSRRTDE